MTTAETPTVPDAPDEPRTSDAGPEDGAPGPGIAGGGSTPPVDDARAPAAATAVPAASRPRYLLVKAHVGFGDRLQALSHAARYAAKFDRILCVDWSDSIWSDGTVNFDTFFEFCGAPTIAPDDLLDARVDSVSPIGWTNQLDRRADSKFLYKAHYVHPLADEDDDAQVVVYGSTGHRVFHRENLCRLRVRREFREEIVAELKKASEYGTVVHLRGTDRQPPERHDDYLGEIATAMADVSTTEPLLVVSDCLPLFRKFQARFPRAVLRTPHLERFGETRGTHFESALPKREFNLQTLIDFFLLTYAPRCVSDGGSRFSNMARFLHDGDYMDILGYDG